MRNGLLLIDKPTGITSHDVVSSVRRKSSQKQVGHAGTLDPLATGLMVVLMGEATKLSDFILNGDKSYEVVCQLGLKTDSGDIDGKILEQKTISVTNECIQSAISELQGEFFWPVPIYSAVKVNGEKLYEKARAGKEIVAPVKKMIFYKTEFVSLSEDKICVRLYCSKGSFVRTWVEKLGEKLGAPTTVYALKRLSSLPYNLSYAVPLDKYSPDTNGHHWIPVEESLPDWPVLKLEGLEEKLIRNGQIPHRVGRFLEIEYMAPHVPGVKVLSRKNNQLIAILGKDERGFSLKRVFNIS